MFESRSPRRAFKTVLLIAAILLGSGFLAHTAKAANPSSGTISQTSPSLTWTGATYTAAANADPSTCPPSADTLNLLCDHFFLTVSLPSDFWLTHTGTVTITINWSSGSNDFDLYIYRQSDGLLVGSSTAGGGETQEQVALTSPLPGTYEARVTPFLVTMSSYSGSAVLAFTNGGPVANPIFPTGGIGFAPATIVDSQRTEGEPLVHIDRSGNIWESGPWGASTNQGFIARSTDNGDSFHNVSPDGLRPNIAPGGGDSDIITDDQGFAYFADLEALTNVGVAVSNDAGNNWRTNILTATDTVVDRQWLAVDNGLTSSPSDNTIFLTFRQLVEGSQILSSPGSTGSTDLAGGLVFQNAGSGTGPQFVGHGAPCGRLIFDPLLRNLYLPCLKGDHVEVTRAHVNPGQRTGLTFKNLELPVSPGGAVGHLFASLTTDSAGNVFVAWVDTVNNNVYLTSSSNAGDTWSAPLQVNGDPANTNVMPWATAGSRGTVDIVFYGTSARGDPNSFPSWRNNRQAATTVKWFTYMVQVQNALSSTPTIFQAQASEHPTDYGQICTQGTLCDVSGGDRTLADFFSVAIDSKGAARIVINDLTNQHHGAALFELTQVAGPSAIGTTLVRNTPNVQIGVTDPPGDAQLPHYFPTGAGPNQVALDILGLQLSQPDTAHLTVTMQLANLVSLTPPTGSTGLIWLTRWQFNTTGDGGEQSYRIFYMGANSTAGGSPTFFAGTGTSAAPTTGVPPGNGCITTTPQNCKIILYPNEKGETGTISTLTGVITITAPLSDIGSPIVGDELFSTTGLTFAYVNGDPILKDADATRSFDYVLGQTTMPSNCPLGQTCKVTGGGYIFTDAQQDHGSFSIEVLVDSSGRLSGKIGYIDHGTGLDFRTALLTSAFFNGNTVTVQGTGKASGVTTNFQVTVQDIAEPGVGQDTFSIALGTGYSKSGVLQAGNIQIH